MSNNGCYPVENHAKVTLDVPDGDGRGHSMSLVVGGQLPESWANDDSQCEKGVVSPRVVGRFWMVFA